MDNDTVTNAYLFAVLRSALPNVRAVYDRTLQALHDDSYMMTATR